MTDRNNHRQRLTRPGATGVARTTLEEDTSNTSTGPNVVATPPPTATPVMINPASKAATNTSPLSSSTSITESSAALSPQEHLLYQQLSQRRTRLEVLASQAEEGVKACEAQAKQLGVNSLEELEALVAKLEREEESQITAFRQALAAEEKLLNEIEQALEQLNLG